MTPYERKMLAADEKYQRMVDYAALHGLQPSNDMLVCIAVAGTDLASYELHNYLRRCYPESTAGEIRARWRKQNQK